MVNSRTAEIAENLANVKARIAKAAIRYQRDPSDICLIVVTKTYPLSDIQILYDLGVRDFGENRIQEGAEKAAANFTDVRWHFQGQIQSNKITALMSWADVIHSLDQLDHAEKMSNRTTRDKSVLLQVSLDGAVHRGGVAPDSLIELAEKISQLPRLSLRGLMAVAPLAEDADRAFARLAEIYQGFIGVFPEARWLSAGMSNDFESAIAHGATHVRVGSSILGMRSKPF